MKVSVFLVLSLITLTAAGQSEAINVPRPAYAYEQIDSIPEDVSLKADRSEMAGFLASKQRARAEFIESVHLACLPFLNGDLSIRGFAANLDGEVEGMRESISAAYERMSAQLSSSASSALENAVSRSGKMSADTYAVGMLAAAPAEAESMFRVLCDKVMADVATPRNPL